MLTVLAWVPPKQSLIQRLTCWWWLRNWNLRHMDTSWGQRKAISAADRTDHCHGPHCSPDPMGPPEKLYKRFLRTICPGKKGEGVLSHWPPSPRGQGLAYEILLNPWLF